MSEQMLGSGALENISKIPGIGKMAVGFLEKLDELTSAMRGMRPTGQSLILLPGLGRIKDAISSKFSGSPAPSPQGQVKKVGRSASPEKALGVEMESKSLYNAIDPELAKKIARDFGIDDSGKGKYGRNGVEFTREDKTEMKTQKYGTHQHAGTQPEGQHTAESITKYIKEHKEKMAALAPAGRGH